MGVSEIDVPVFSDSWVDVLYEGVAYFLNPLVKNSQMESWNQFREKCEVQ